MSSDQELGTQKEGEEWAADDGYFSEVSRCSFSRKGLPWQAKTLSIPFQEWPHFQAICPPRQLLDFIYEAMMAGSPGGGKTQLSVNADMWTAINNPWVCEDAVLPYRNA